MMWRVRTTLPDRPGLLARIATACGEAEVNIVRFQVFPGSPHVTDELVVSAGDAWTEVELAALFTRAGGEQVSVTRTGEEALADAPTRWLDAVHEVLEEERDVEEVLRELLATEPPDVADYSGHDVLDLHRRTGTVLRISRAVPFTPAERARAQALLSLVSDAGVDVPRISPSTTGPAPLVRGATLADLDAVAALHGRCSVETLYRRYQVPLRMPMTTRLARRLVLPDGGESLLAQVGLDVVGHATLEPVDGQWVARVLVEDAWQGRSVGTLLIKEAARRAKALGADSLTVVTAGRDDAMLRAVGAAGFVARVERHDGAVHITVSLAAVRAAGTG